MSTFDTSLRSSWCQLRVRQYFQSYVRQLTSLAQTIRLHPFYTPILRITPRKAKLCAQFAAVLTLQIALIPQLVQISLFESLYTYFVVSTPKRFVKVLMYLITKCVIQGILEQQCRIDYCSSSHISAWWPSLCPVILIFREFIISLEWAWVN